MFRSLRLRGGTAAILWGYRTAAALTSWTIAKNTAGEWMLTGQLARIEPFMVRQKPLLFTAPRTGTRDGFWAWGVESITVGPTSVVAKLGEPEQ